MPTNPRRGVRQTDLPLRCSVVREGEGRYRYSIYRNDGTLTNDASPFPYSTETAAMEAGQRALQLRSAAAKPARKQNPAQ